MGYPKVDIPEKWGWGLALGREREGLQEGRGAGNGVWGWAAGWRLDHFSLEAKNRAEHSLTWFQV